MELNKKIIIIISLLTFSFLFTNIAYTDNREVLSSLFTILLISLFIGLTVSLIVEVVKKILSLLAKTR